MNGLRELKSKYSTAHKFNAQYPHQISTSTGRKSQEPNKRSPPPETNRHGDKVEPAIGGEPFPERTLDYDQLGSAKSSKDREPYHATPPRIPTRQPSLSEDDAAGKLTSWPSDYHLSSAAADASRCASPDSTRTWQRSSFPVPNRTSSRNQNGGSINQILSRSPERRVPNFSTNAVSPPPSPTKMDETSFDRSSGEQSDFSQDTTATSVDNLYPLQTKGPDSSDARDLEPLGGDDPRSYDLVEPPQERENVGVYALEKQADLLMSHEHLSAIFANSKLLLKFTGFLNSHRPHSIPLLIYYLDALKAIRAIKYSNAIAEALEPIRGCEFTKDPARPSLNRALEEKANKAFDLLCKEDLPAYRRINGTLAPHLREASEGLAEVFCLTDPSRPDNPIVFASEEFARTTQYGMNYAIGRNCRFLQGPSTTKSSIRRLAESCQAGRESNEIMVNYRRDGSPFVNLLMTAPLLDSRGEVRYYIGAQVDVSGLLKSCSELPALAELVDKQTYGSSDRDEIKDEFQELSEMFNGTELSTVRRYGGKMHREYADDSDVESMHGDRPRRVLLQDSSQDVIDEQLDQTKASIPSAVQERVNGKLAGVYQHYLLLRPAPSLRILFSSPSLRVPGILQSPFLNRVGGSPRVRSDLFSALSEGRGVTAKIRWLARPDEDGEGEGRPRWIHCTPLLGHSGAVGVWMVVLVDEEGSKEMIGSGRRFRAAPPVSSNIHGRDWGSGSSDREREQSDRDRRLLNAYDVDSARRGGSVDNRSPSRGVASPRGHTRLDLDQSPISSRSQSASRKPSLHVAAMAAQGGRQANGRPESIRTDTGTSRDFALRGLWTCAEEIDLDV
ncbi:hypothetical protein B0A48_13270 [Cryoendolithus antarcticus]|uniref:PAC domain-containing protein n=1 Tax=Cryoendolithus antarcticus TaxID=1507870 RepID=A0A1V8SPD8_9PEZI|nr:hypothetical protein B0A48_13270 [Cryoendolithus antarcticus]